MVCLSVHHPQQGGGWGSVAAFYESHYGIPDVQASARRIAEQILRQPEGHAVVVLAHNGPTGLGSERSDICGIDWIPGGRGMHRQLSVCLSVCKQPTLKEGSVCLYAAVKTRPFGRCAWPRAPRGAFPVE
jgi:uncharacterized protein (TIGR04168 family)